MLFEFDLMIFVVNFAFMSLILWLFGLILFSEYELLGHFLDLKKVFDCCLNWKKFFI